MLTLKKLKFNNIRRFTSEQTIDFLGRDKLLQIDGRNENTGGSSGAGKSTVFLALDYLLGIADIPSTVLQSRLTKEPMYVTGEFDVNGVALVVTRSKKDGLTVVFGDESVSGNVKLAEERLQEIVGIPKSVFKKMVHKKQKEGGFFIDMGGKQVYEFLSEVLDLEKYQSALANVIEEIAENKKAIDELAVKIQLESSNIKDLEQMLAEKQRPISNIDKEQVDQLESQLKQAQEEKERLELKLNSELNALEEPSITKPTYDDSQAVALQQKLVDLEHKHEEASIAKSKIEKRMAEIPLLKEKALNLGQKISDITSQAKEIEAAICPTCAQPWIGETAKNKLSSLEEEKNILIQQALEAKSKIEQSNELSQGIQKVESIIYKTSQSIKEIQQDILSEQTKAHTIEQEYQAELSQKIALFKQTQQNIKDQYLQEIDLIKNRINELKVDYQTHKHDLATYEKNLALYTAEVDRLGALISNKNTLTNNMTKDRDKLAKEVEVAEEAKRLIKAYTIQTFQGTLDAIGESATDILSNIPNMNNATVYFEGCKETKKGTLKDEVTGIINLDGENIPIKSLSGGERTSIDLAVDLAVIDVIETRAGKGASFYIIDEPFDGLDSVCRENSLEILKQLDTNKTIIMVDHSSELKEMVSDVITVVRNGETSRIA